MSRRNTWQEIYGRFDPEQSAPREWRADRELSPAEEICRTLDVPFGTPRSLLTGTIGTGKTTELRRVAEARAAKGSEFVIFLDLGEHFDKVVGDTTALQHIDAWEVCALIGVALIRAAKDRLGHEFTKEEIDGLDHAWTALTSATGTASSSPHLDVASLAKSMVLLASSFVPHGAAATAGLTAIEKVADAVKWQRSIGLKKKRLPDQDVEMQSLLGSVNRLIGSFQLRAIPLLLVIDGLDRIRSLAHAKALFLDSEMIGQLVCRMVVCGPWALRHDKATSAVRRFTNLYTLANEPVLDEADPGKEGPGVGFFCEVFQRRTRDLGGGPWISEALLRRLAYYSGGRGRDFVRSIRMAAERAWSADATELTQEIIDAVLDEARRRMETGVDAGDVELLARVANDPRHALPEGENARELLSYGHLLPYPNGSEWFYPHPLLTIRKILRSTAGPTG